VPPLPPAAPSPPAPDAAPPAPEAAGTSAPPPSVIVALPWNVQPPTNSEVRSSAPQTVDRRRHRALLIETDIDEEARDLSPIDQETEGLPGQPAATILDAVMVTVAMWGIRRRLAVAAALALVSIVWTSGCGNGDPVDPGDGAASPARAGDLSAAAQACVGTVDAPSGKVCGLAIAPPAGTERALFNYRGIPYALPPVGDLRFAPPEPQPRSHQLRRATEFGAICPQDGATNDAEDCLFLNVWTPRAAALRHERLPVMVFIHGGYFVLGAGSLPIYDGAFLAASGDVVVVTLNYRLGSLGFLSVPELGLTGNYGILDQRMALRWVAENIAAFGGDPRKVTIFGESAGAMSVGLHLFSIPSQPELFRAAIMESNPLALPYPDLAAQVEAKWAEFHDALCFETNQPSGCPFDVAALRALPLATLETADGDFESAFDVIGRLQVPTPIANALPWSPIVDGQIFSGETLIQSQPVRGFASGPNGAAQPKPYMIGVNRDEGALFADLANQAANGISQVNYETLLQIAFGTPAAATIVGFTADGRRPYDPADQGALPPWFANSAQAATVDTLINDFLFRCGSFLATDNVVTTPGTKPVHAYLFAQAPIFTSDNSTACAPFPADPSLESACHSFELPYVFGTFSATNAAQVSAANARLARRIARHWTNFARTLDPGDGWRRYRPTSAPGGNNIQILSTGRAATGALPVPADPIAASNCTALWATQPPFSGSFPTELPGSSGP
jgi:para-nitrobenzyl esterase